MLEQTDAQAGLAQLVADQQNEVERLSEALKLSKKKLRRLEAAQEIS